MRCAVTRDEYGNILDVVSQNGNQSKLYFDLLFQLNDPELALKEYALTFTKSFNDSMGSAVRDNNGEHTIDTYNRYNQGGLLTEFKDKYKDFKNRWKKVDYSKISDIVLNNPISSDVYLFPNNTGFLVELKYNNRLIGSFHSFFSEEEGFLNDIEISPDFQGYGFGKILTMISIDVSNSKIGGFSSDSRGLTLQQKNVYSSLLNKKILTSDNKIDIDKANNEINSILSNLKIKTISQGGVGVIKEGVSELFESNPELANAVYESLGFGINKLTNKLKSPSFNTQKEYYLAKGVSSLLSDIVTFTTDNDTKVLAEAILKIPNIDKIGLNVTKFDKETKDKGTIIGSPDALGIYKSFENLIEIIGTLDKESFERVFLHEVIHSITVNEYYSNKKFADKINKLYNYTLKFKDYKTSTGTLLGEMYGMTNAKEFMSEAMTNPNFILELSKYYSPVQEKLKEKNIFQEFIDLIVNLVKEKISSKGKKYIEDNLGTVVLNTISNYANIRYSNFKSISKLENNRIKPGVQELFESNETLANAVYEALGFKTKSLNTLNDLPTLIENLKKAGFNVNQRQSIENLVKTLKQGLDVILLEDGLQGGRLSYNEDTETLDLWFTNGLEKQDNELRLKAEKIFNGEITPQQKQEALQLYSQYLDTIFPDSKVKDIVYRGQDGKEKISKNNTQGSKQIGIYFSDRWKNAKFYATTQTKSEKGDVIAVLLDIKNPAIDTIKNFGNLNEKPQNVDGIISTTSLEKVVFEPEQIHILGNKQDIQGFTNYVKGGVQPTTLDIPTELGFRDLTTDEYYQLDEDNLASQYASQLENATVEQKKAFDAISKMHNSVYKEVVGDDVNTGKPMYTYTMKDDLGNDVTLTSVTTTLNDKPRYSFDGTNTEDTFINWGNTADMILSGIVEGKTIEQIEKQLSAEFPLIDVNEIMTQEAREQLYKLFTEYVNEQKSKGNVVLTQIRHGNLNKKIGGTADIIVVLPDGKVQYVDLKTSYKPFVGTDSTFKREFKKSPISIKASKFERYSAQLSTYAAIGTHNGLTVDITNPINILPIYLKTEDKTAIEIELQTEENNTYYIKGKYMQDLVEKYSSRYTSSTLRDIFSKMLSALYRAKDTFTKAGDIDKANEIGQLIKDLDNTEFYSGITNMVNNAYELFVGRKDSLYKILNSLLETEVTADNVSEVLNTINEIESLIDLYHPANENSALQQLSRQLREQNIIIEDGSFASKLREVIGTIADMREGIKDKLPSMLAEYLVTAIPANANDNIIKQYEAKLKKLKVISGREGDRNKRKTKELEKEIEDFQLQYNITDNNGKLQPDLKAMLEREIKDGGYKDISTLDRYISSAVQMPVGFLATFAIKLKTALEEARQLAIDFQYKANDAFNEFMKDRSFQQPEKLYEGIYYNKEVYGRDEATGKYVKKNNVLGLVSFIDYNAFNQAKAKMYEEASLIEDNNDRNIFISNWYRDNTQQRPDEDIKANGVTLVESINTVYKRKRLKLGSDSDRFKAWEALNTIIDKDGKKRYIGELQIPNLSKYKSKDFEKLSQDKSKFKLYTFALQTYFESQSLQPARSTFDYEEYKYIAPYIMKSSMDRLTDNGFKSLINNKIDDIYKRLDDDMNEHGYDPNTKSIHILYYNSANPVKYDDASKDLMNTILRYKIAADRYAKRKEVGVIGDALLSRVRNTNPLQVDDAGNSISEKLNNRITGFLDKKLKSKGNNAADLLEAFIEAQIYGITRKDSKLNGIDLNKLTDNFMSFAAFTQLGLDVTLAVSNSLTANITTAIDAAGKRVYGVGAWAKASGKYWTYEKDFISDAMNPVKKSLIGQLVDIYDPMQGDFVDNYGRKIGKGVVKAKWNSSQAFTGMRKGEHRAQVTAMIAALSETKVKYTNPTTGEVSMIRLIDAYEIPAGQTRIQLKEGVELSKQVGLVDINVQNTLHSVNTSLHGIYNSFEAPDISRHWLGRLLQMYRKYLPAGLKYRYKREGFNYQLGDFTEGTYASFYGTLVSDWRELVRALQGKETYLSDIEVANLRRALAEQAVVLSTGLLVIALQAALEGEDDDEKDAAKWLLYTSLRLNQEIALYGAALNPLSYGIPSYRPLWKTFTNVSAITTLGDKVVRLMGSALGDSVNIITGEDIERYERDAGLYEKGDSKTLANFLKLLGINNRKLLQDPEDAVNLLILEKGAGG